MVAEAWKKEIAWIYLPLIGEDRCIVPSGVKMPAVCQTDGDEAEKVSSGWRTWRRRASSEKEEAGARRLGEVARAPSMRGRHGAAPCLLRR